MKIRIRYCLLYYQTWLTICLGSAVWRSLRCNSICNLLCIISLFNNWRDPYYQPFIYSLQVWWFHNGLRNFCWRKFNIHYIFSNKTYFPLKQITVEIKCKLYFYQYSEKKAKYTNILNWSRNSSFCLNKERLRLTI